MLSELWSRITRGRREAAVERDATIEQMSPDEREFIEESLEETQADTFAAGHLGGIDPARLLPDAEPPPDDVPPRA